MPKPKVKIERGLPADIRTQTKVWNIAVNLVLIAGVVVRVEPAAAIAIHAGFHPLQICARVFSGYLSGSH